jgi:Fe-S-cluster-containing dehydrogenase component
VEMSCPGRRSRNLDSQIVRCGECGSPVEIFSDEQKARCRCGKVILRDALPTCISWCPAAERCLGEVADLREVRRRIQSLRRESDAAGYVRKVARKIAESRREPGSPHGAEEGGKKP